MKTKALSQTKQGVNIWLLLVKSFHILDSFPFLMTISSCNHYYV